MTAIENLRRCLSDLARRPGLNYTTPLTAARAALRDIAMWLAPLQNDGLLSINTHLILNGTPGSGPIQSLDIIAPGRCIALSIRDVMAGESVLTCIGLLNKPLLVARGTKIEGEEGVITAWKMFFQDESDLTQESFYRWLYVYLGGDQPKVKTSEGHYHTMTIDPSISRDTVAAMLRLSGVAIRLYRAYKAEEDDAVLLEITYDVADLLGDANEATLDEVCRFREAVQRSAYLSHCEVCSTGGHRRDNTVKGLFEPCKLCPHRPQ